MSRKLIANFVRRGPLGLLGMVCLIILVEAFINRHALRLYDMDEWAYRWSAREASGIEQKNSILCFGDSLVKLGVIPRVVRERVKTPVFNLAISGSQATTSYFMLRRALESGSRPSSILVDFNPPLLRVGPRHNLLRWPALLNPVEAGQLARWADDPGLFGEIVVNWAFPSLRGRSTIRQAISEAFAAKATVTEVWNRMALRNWSQNKGAQMMTGSERAQNLSAAEVETMCAGFYPEWKIHPTNKKGIDRFLRLAQRYKIPVYWVLPPLLPAFHDELAKHGIDAQHEQFIRSWLQKYPDLVILDGRRKFADLNAFWDPQHLSVAGAAAFSVIIGDTIAKIDARLDRSPLGDRWINLPDIGLIPIDPKIENVDQSTVAVLNEIPLKR